MKSVWVVATNTTKEILRDRILYGLIVVAFFLVLASILLGNLSVKEQAHIITDFGLVAVELSCCGLAIFVGSSLVFREIEKQTVLLLISKPVKRAEFLVGKFAGLGMVLILVNVAISAFLTLIFHFYGTIHWYQFFVSQLAVLLESLFLLSVSIFFGVFARPSMTAIFSLSVWILGHGINDLHYFSSKSRVPFMNTMGTLISRVFPNLDYFNFRDAVLYGDPITRISIERAVFLSVAWFVILIIGSMWIFERRDFV